MRRVLISIALGAVAGASAAAPLRVVTTLPAYSSIAQFVGGGRVEARSIARGDEDD